MKACVFVDGENLRYALNGVLQRFTDFQQEDYLPSDAKWAEFFDWIVTRAAGAECTRLRTYWYVIDAVDYRPYGFKKLKLPDEQNKLMKILCRDPSARDRLAPLKGVDLLKEMDAVRNELDKKQRVFQPRFDGWRTVQNGISLKHDAVEFRRSGAISYDLFQSRLGDEKTVDVKLALDAYMLRNIYDVAVIVSGDQDYVPAAQVLKDAGKTVVNAAFEKKNGELLPGGARRLNMATDRSFSITFADLVKFMGVAEVSQGQQGSQQAAVVD